MEQIKKGDYGYLGQQTKWEILKVLIFFAAAFGVLFLGIHLTGDKNNLLTVVAVLGLLPAAKELITLIMFIRARKFSCPPSLYEAVEGEIYNKEDAAYDKADPLIIVYDLYMTGQEKNYPILSMCCRNKTLVGMADWEKFDYKKAEEHIQIMLKQNGFKNISVKIFSEKEKYINRLRELREKETADYEEDQAILRLMLNLSL